jgi:hypothetical protein
MRYRYGTSWPEPSRCSARRATKPRHFYMTTVGMTQPSDPVADRPQRVAAVARRRHLGRSAAAMDRAAAPAGSAL